MEKEKKTIVDNQVRPLLENALYETPTHKYDGEGNLVPIEQKPLSRAQRRMMKRLQERRIKKLKKLKLHVEKEKKRLERAQEAEAKRKAKSSN